MNYYAIWISFSDRSNLFYNPRNYTLEALPPGTPMPNDWFFRSRDLDSHKATAIHLAHDHPHFEEIIFHLTELRPQDPDYATVNRHFS